jgi:hypothetical protein
LETKNLHDFLNYPLFRTFESQIIHNRSLVAGFTCCVRFFLAVFLAFYVCAGIATAQPQSEFADDFSVDSIRYTGSSFESVGTASAIGEPGAIRMTASQDGTGRANRTVSTLVPSDTFLVTTTFDPATNLEAGSAAVAYFQVWGK